MKTRVIGEIQQNNIQVTLRNIDNRLYVGIGQELIPYEKMEVLLNTLIEAVTLVQSTVKK